MHSSVCRAAAGDAVMAENAVRNLTGVLNEIDVTDGSAVLDKKAVEAGADVISKNAVEAVKTQVRGSDVTACSETQDRETGLLNEIGVTEGSAVLDEHPVVCTPRFRLRPAQPAGWPADDRRGFDRREWRVPDGVDMTALTRTRGHERLTRMLWLRAFT